MASRSIQRIPILILALALCLSALPSSALAADSALQEQVLKFYLDPALVPDLNFARSVLPKYVADMNAILAKNTNRQLIFDPETGIIPTTTKPNSDSYLPPLPTRGFEIWAHAVGTSGSVSYGAYAGTDISGAGVIGGMHWTRLYDPDSLDSSQVNDYTLQIDHMLHELAHIFGAGIGEYYKLASITDTSGVQPLLNINLYTPGDIYWRERQDFLPDPLLQFTRTTSRAEYLSAVEYSSLTAAVMNGSYRNGIPAFDHYLIQVVDADGLPVRDADVKVWNVSGTSSNPSQLLFESLTDANGQLELKWGGSGSAHTVSNFLRLIKVFKDGRSIVQPRYFSIFDAESAMLVSGENPIKVTLQPAKPTTSVLISDALKDGWVRESVQGSMKGETLNADTGALFLGDDSLNRQYRTVLSFPTGSLPDGAVITSVTLKVREKKIIGTNPFMTHGNLQADVSSLFFSTRAALQRTDFQAAAGQRGVGIFSSTPVGGWYTTQIDSQWFNYINTTGSTQFRLRFDLESDGDGSTDVIQFFSGNAVDPSRRPQLIVEYYLP